MNDDDVLTLTDKGKEYFAKLCHKWLTQKKLSKREHEMFIILSTFIIESGISKVPLSPLFKYGYFNLQELIEDVNRAYLRTRC